MSLSSPMLRNANIRQRWEEQKHQILERRFDALTMSISGIESMVNSTPPGESGTLTAAAACPPGILTQTLSTAVYVRPHTGCCGRRHHIFYPSPPRQQRGAAEVQGSPETPAPAGDTSRSQHHHHTDGPITDSRIPSGAWEMRSEGPAGSPMLTPECATHTL